MFIQEPFNLTGGVAAAAGYEIDYSCRFNPDDNTYLVSTLGTPSSTTAFTMSTWVKRGVLGNWTAIYSSYKGSGSGDRSSIYFRGGDDNALTVTGEEGAATPLQKNTTQLFRDPHAWQHIVISFDLTASSSTYCRLYINGSQVTSFSTDTVPSADQALAWNRDGYTFTVGCDAKTLAGDDFDGYLSQTCLIDGQTLTASSFGETNSSGVWVPIDITGLTFGNNGFLLDFADDSDLGNDVSGNNNDFTSSGLAANDQVTDTPTNNFPTWDPLYPGGANAVLSNGNLKLTAGSGNRPQNTSVVFPATGEYWVEFTVTVTPSAAGVFLGLIDADGNFINYQGDGDKDINGSVTSTWGATFGQGDRIGFHVDLDDDVITPYKNGASQGSIASTPFASTLTGGMVRMYMHGNSAADAISINYGQLGFEDTPPDSSVALCTTNIPVPTIADPSAHFQPNTRTGDGSAGAVAQTGNSQFGTDLIIIKNRDETDEWKVVDTGRGATYEINTDTANAQSQDSNGVTAFSATDGYTIGTGAGGYNDNTEKFIDYHFQEGSTPGMGINASVSHTQGSETEIAHGMGLVPAFAMLKETDAATSWWIFHKDLTSKTANYLIVDTSVAEQTITDVWGTQTSTNFVIGDAAGGLASGTYVCYSFAEVAGFSSFGTYTSNGSADGPVIITGFKPALTIFKRFDAGNQWIVFDGARNTYNPVDLRSPLDSNLDPETSGIDLDYLSNGFKLRNVSAIFNGGSGVTSATYIYMSWAINPFGGHGGTFGGGVAPATAR